MELTTITISFAYFSAKASRMKEYLGKSHLFNFTYLPDFASFLLRNKLEEFVTVGIRFCREANLPILKPLSRLSEQELVRLSMESNRNLLEAIAMNKMLDYIEKGIETWASNSIGYLDREEVMVEDFTMGFYLRRKLFAYFLDGYTKNLVMQKFIIAELDLFTTQEELIAYKIFHSTKQENFEVYNTFLLDTQQLAGIGSFLINYQDSSRSIFTQEYKNILGIEGRVDFEKFLENVHPEDRKRVSRVTEEVMHNGGTYELEYRYMRHDTVKIIWSKGAAEMHDGKLIKLKGSIRDVTERANEMLQLQEAQMMYRLGQELNRTGNWSWDMGKGKLTWSSEMYRIFEIEEGTQVGLGDFISFIHPHHRDEFKKNLENHLVPGGRSEQTFKITTPSGVEKTVRGISVVQVTGHNLIARCYGTCQDITV